MPDVIDTTELENEILSDKTLKTVTVYYRGRKASVYKDVVEAKYVPHAFGGQERFYIIFQNGELIIDSIEIFSVHIQDQE
ncbi:hypothetical protein phiOC_p134 [Ochrobactrum phage vB_OspM_OC]|nr:hypothetical protein phiOC_p134 [Ochrobactrum phage vB_OspM_OC]